MSEEEKEEAPPEPTQQKIRIVIPGYIAGLVVLSLMMLCFVIGYTLLQQRQGNR